MTNAKFKPPVDIEARNHAMDPKQSLIVSAPAGSGKTYLLTRRILNLLMHVEDPTHVVAITFTKKAASEMQERLIQCLEQADETIAQRVLKRSQEKGWDILNQELSIMTIDAYCAWLLSHTDQPLLFPVSQSPKDLYQATVFSLYQKEHWTQPQHNLLNAFHGQYYQIETLLTGLLTTRDQWSTYLQSQDLAEHCKQGILTINTLHLESLSQSLSPHQATIDSLFSLHYDIATQLNEPVIFNRSDDLKTTSVHLANMLLTQNGSPRKSLNKRQGIYPKSRINQIVADLQAAFIENHRQLIEQLSATQQSELHSTRELPCPQALDEVQFLEDLSHVLTELLTQLDQDFLSQQTYDFTEIALKAIYGLQHNKTLQSFSRSHIHHILIDEFQDTSATQYQLLSALIDIWPKNEHRTLFAVGDPMQSIYRFRQADVRLFLKLQTQTISHIKPKPVFLQCNFRSSTRVIEQINHLFEFILPEKNIPYHAAITYSEATPTQPQAQHHGIFVHQEEANHPGAQAIRCVQLVGKLQIEHPGESIAILVQARSHLKQILPALESHQIAFNAIDIYPTVNLAAIQDLTALLSAILDPYDHLSWHTTLRSPLCGLSLDSLAIIPIGMDMVRGLAVLSESLSLSDDQPFFTKFYATLRDANKHCAHPVHRVWYIWTELNGSELYPQDQSLAIENWFSEVTKRHQENIALHRDAVLSHFSSSFTSKTSPNARVELLTTHKSKGLEYDHVIIPHLEKKKPPQSTPLFYCEAGDYPIIQPSFTQNQQNIDYFKLLNKTRNSYESMRLFYVACTRAKSTLHLMGYMADKPNPGSWFEAVWNYLQHPTCLQVITENTPFEQMTTLCKPVQRRSLLKTSVPAPSPTLPSQSEEAKQGTALHYYMQHIMHTNIKHKWQYYLLQLGFLPKKCSHLHQITDHIQQQLTPESNLSWVLQDYHWSHNEWEIIHQGETHIIDRVFCDEGNYVIIDYKFPQNEQSLSDQQLSKRYSQQLQTYHIALKHYLETQGILAPIKCYLLLPQTDRLIPVAITATTTEVESISS